MTRLRLTILGLTIPDATGQDDTPIRLFFSFLLYSKVVRGRGAVVGCSSTKTSLAFRTRVAVVVPGGRRLMSES